MPRSGSAQLGRHVRPLPPYLRQDLNPRHGRLPPLADLLSEVYQFLPRGLAGVGRRRFAATGLSERQEHSHRPAPVCHQERARRSRTARTISDARAFSSRTPISCMDTRTQFDNGTFVLYHTLG